MTITAASPAVVPTTSVRRTVGVIAVVADDALGRALARDLRRQYGATHQVIRFTDPTSALDGLRDLLAHGRLLSLVIADANDTTAATDLLEDVLDVAPLARRLLLAAYADIASTLLLLDELDIDGYLVKPWGAPEQGVYPVIDELLTRPDEATDGLSGTITLIGQQWSSQTQATRDFLARNQVPFRSLDVDTESGRRLLALAGLQPTAHLPVAVMPDGEVIVAPTPQQLAGRAGLATTAGSDLYDLVVVGGGPAGLGAAVYGASEGLRTLLVEKEATGGQAGTSSLIENYLGFPHGLSGAELAQRARDQALRFGVEILTAAEVRAVDAVGDGQLVRFRDGKDVTALATVLATGVSYTRLHASSVDDFTGRGVYYGAAAHDAAECQGEDVFVVGAANSAGQAALFFARHARSVTVLCRGPALGTAMSQYLVARIGAADNIAVRTGTEVVDAAGVEHLERVLLRTEQAAVDEWVPCSRLFLFIGAEPRTDWLGQDFLRDARGFLLTGPELLREDGRPRSGWPLRRLPRSLESSVPGVFVAGDVRAASVKRVASAVGEGALAVTLVHRHLGALA